MKAICLSFFVIWLKLQSIQFISVWRIEKWTLSFLIELLNDLLLSIQVCLMRVLCKINSDLKQRPTEVPVSYNWPMLFACYSVIPDRYIAILMAGPSHRFMNIKQYYKFERSSIDNKSRQRPSFSYKNAVFYGCYCILTFWEYLGDCMGTQWMFD